MKTTLALLAIALLSGADLTAADFTRKSTFASVDDFVAATRQFRPGDHGSSDLAALFSTKDLGENADGSLIPAKGLDEPQRLWENDEFALIFVTANPPTQATKSAIGVLFFLHKKPRDQWRIADLHRFIATGKYSNVSAELTATASSGNTLGFGTPPVISVIESQGGRGYAYEVHASYVVKASKLVRLEPE